jgi:hypothetical protein
MISTAWPGIDVLSIWYRAKSCSAATTSSSFKRLPRAGRSPDHASEASRLVKFVSSASVDTCKPLNEALCLEDLAAVLDVRFALNV